MTKFIIRDITKADLHNVAFFTGLMAQDFAYNLEFEYHAFIDFLTNFIANNVVFCRVVVTDDGLIVGYILANIVANAYSGKLQACKAVWVVSPKAAGYGIKLLKLAETWAKLNGCCQFNVSSPTNRTADLLEHKGYTFREVVLVKTL